MSSFPRIKPAKLRFCDGLGVLVLLLAIGFLGATVYYIRLANFEYAFMAHLATAVLFPWPLWLFIAPDYRKPFLIMVLFFLLCLFIPLISGLGLLLALTVGSYMARKSEKINYTTFNNPEIPEGILESLGYMNNLSSNIRSVLEYSNEPQERIRAVLATRKMVNQDAIPILQIALLDPVDEIRLLAYSMLNTKEKKINASIQAHLNILAEQSELSMQEKARHFHFIAESYWELSYLGLEQGQARIHVLNAANYYASAASNTFVADSELYFLRARICLELAQYRQATENFNIALQCGMSEQKLAPYQAELAFAERRYEDVKFYMQQAKHAVERATLSNMVKQWL